MGPTDRKKEQRLENDKYDMALEVSQVPLGPLGMEPQENLGHLQVAQRICIQINTPQQCQAVAFCTGSAWRYTPILDPTNLLFATHSARVGGKCRELLRDRDHHSSVLLLYKPRTCSQDFLSLSSSYADAIDSEVIRCSRCVSPNVAFRPCCNRSAQDRSTGQPSNTGTPQKYQHGHVVVFCPLITATPTALGP